MGQAKKETDGEFTAAVSNKKLLNDVVKFINPEVDAKLRQGVFAATFTGDKEELQKAVTAFQLTACIDNAFCSNVTPFGLPDIRVCLQGKCSVFGIPIDSITGADIPEKLAWLSSMTKPGLIDLCKAKGFIAHLKPGHLIAIPVAYIVISYVVGETVLLRWSVMDVVAAAVELPLIQTIEAGITQMNIH